ncbi:MAG: adaptor protein MecA [Clostridia bacterium]|nr:adaptor protein MecA [Clostridia bacterium]
MRIEKINDRQIKFILSKKDLTERNIEINEFAYGSDKAKAFFKDIMKQAYDKFGFETNNAPLMIEASTSSPEDITIIVTKVADKENAAPNNQLTQNNNKKRNNNRKKVHSPYFLYSFKNLDDISEVAYRLSGVFFGPNAVFKMDDKYYMLLRKEGVQKKPYAYIKAVLSDYGTFQKSSELTENHLLEHGEVIIKENAIEILNKFL